MLTSRKLLGGPRGLQVEKSQALWGTKRLTIRKPFKGPRGLQVAKIASPLGDQGAYK